MRNVKGPLPQNQDSCSHAHTPSEPIFPTSNQGTQRIAVIEIYTSSPGVCSGKACELDHTGALCTPRHFLAVHEVHAYPFPTCVTSLTQPWTAAGVDSTCLAWMRARSCAMLLLP